MVLRRGSLRQGRHGEEMAHEDTTDPIEGKQPHKGKTFFVVTKATNTIIIIIIVDHTINVKKLVSLKHGVRAINQT